MAAAASALSLDVLDELLTSAPTFEHRKMLSDLDGFLTAVAIGPEAIPASEWLRRIWGSKPPVFDPEELKDALVDFFMDSFDGIVETLEHDPGAYEPVIYENPATGETTIEDWVGGFLGGVSLRRHAWQAIIRSEPGHIHFMPIAALVRGKDGNYVLDEAELDQVRAEAGDELAEAVVGMYRFFKQNRHHFEGATKLGRNDPCFCGSGRKFKKCCGAGR